VVEERRRDEAERQGSASTLIIPALAFSTGIAFSLTSCTAHASISTSSIAAP
jgi:hypothetical protein